MFRLFDITVYLYTHISSLYISMDQTRHKLIEHKFQKQTE